MQKRRFFDAAAMVGQRGIKHRLDAWRTEELISEMERVGISGTLIYHGIAREYDPMYGNMSLLEELKKSPRLSGCWVGLPHHMGDFPRAAEFVAKMRENSIVGTKLFPKLNLILQDVYWGQEREISSNDKIRMAAVDGKPLTDILVIDAHAHLLHDGARGVARYPMAQSE